MSNLAPKIIKGQHDIMLFRYFDSVVKRPYNKPKKLKKSLTSGFFSYILNKTTTFFLAK